MTSQKGNTSIQGGLIQSIEEDMHCYSQTIDREASVRLRNLLATEFNDHVF